MVDQEQWNQQLTGFLCFTEKEKESLLTDDIEDKITTGGNGDGLQSV
jgi:hypothetical protein